MTTKELKDIQHFRSHTHDNVNTKNECVMSVVCDYFFFLRHLLRFDNELDDKRDSVEKESKQTCCEKLQFDFCIEIVCVQICILKNWRKEITKTWTEVELQSVYFFFQNSCNAQTNVQVFPFRSRAYGQRCCCWSCCWCFSLFTPIFFFTSFARMWWLFTDIFGLYAFTCCIRLISRRECTTQPHIKQKNWLSIQGECTLWQVACYLYDMKLNITDRFTCDDKQA